MDTEKIELISHLSEVPRVLSGGGLGADHVIGATAFTADVRHATGEPYTAHRFALLLIADPNTAHSMKMQENVSLDIIEGLLDRFRELMYGVFGAEAMEAALLNGMAVMLVAHAEAEDTPDASQN